jgi:hypothetical protein
LLAAELARALGDESAVLRKSDSWPCADWSLMKYLSGKERKPSRVEGR